jgi:serine protease Do
MTYYDDPGSFRRRSRAFSFFTIVAIALVSGLLGGALTIGIFSAIEKSKSSSSQLSLNESTNPPVNVNIDTSALPVVEVSRAVGPAVVGIANFQSRGGVFGGSGLTEVGSGSGFIIDSTHGYIITNNHVIEGAEKIMVSLADGRNLAGKLVGADARTDLAVVQIAEASNLTAVKIGDSSELQVGEPVVAIGNPGGQEFARSVTTGVVSATNRILNIEGESSFNLIQTDAAINPGNSGGPLTNYKGEVIGINSAKNQEQGFEGMGFAIPITDAMPTIEQLIAKGYASHPALLVNIDSRYTEEYAAQRGWPAGAYVAAVSVGGPAEKAGIKAGDIITKVNGAEVTNSLGLTRELFKYKPGDKVTVTCFRDGTSMDFTATLGELRS